MQIRAGALDSAGAGLSGLCLIHCLALPLLGAIVPAAAGLAHAQWVHVAILALAAPIAAYALLRPERGLQPSPVVSLIGLAGLALLALGAFGPHAIEEASSIMGGLTLAGAHLLNWRRRHRHATPCCEAGAD